MTHILSFDVEHWYDGNLCRPYTTGAGTGAAAGQMRLPASAGRLSAEVDLLLSLLKAAGVKATFFILGSVAKTYPEVVRRIAAEGHEIGCHGMEHEMVRDLQAEQHLNGLRDARALLQDLTGQPVDGHRAPSWSIDRSVPWVVETLLDAGFTYDSSIFPMRTPLYGEPSCPTGPFWLTGRDRGPGGRRLLELPPAVLRLGPFRVPFGGGLYWRLLPSVLIQGLLRGASRPQVTYFHPWELNPDPLSLPRRLPPAERLALRWGVGRAAGRKLTSLLSTVPFQTFGEGLERWRNEPGLATVSLVGETAI